MAYFHDLTYVCAPSALQHGAAAGLEQLPPEFYTQLAADHQSKRERILAALRDAGMEPSVPAGAYYVLARATRLPGATSAQKARHLLAADRRCVRCRFGVLPAGPRRRPAALLLCQEGRRSGRGLRPFTAVIELVRRSRKRHLHDEGPVGANPEGIQRGRSACLARNVFDGYGATSPGRQG